MSRLYRSRLDSFRTLRLTLNKLRSNIRPFHSNILSNLGNISPKRHDVKEPTWINLIRDPITWYESSFYFKRLGWSQKPGARRRNDTEVCFRIKTLPILIRWAWSRIGYIDVGDGCWRHKVVINITVVLKSALVWKTIKDYYWTVHWRKISRLCILKLEIYSILLWRYKRKGM